MKILAMIKIKYATLNANQKCVVLAFGAVCMVAALFALGLVLGSARAGNQKSAEDAGPMMVRNADRIMVPSASPLRARLAVGAVGASAAAHIVALPAVVEADPARTVNILPPLSGRLTELRVKLGDRVQRGQLLAVISSPDLDQAFADADKARDAHELARKMLERARSVYDAGGNAVKDMEQATSNLAQADAELKRAQGRLAILGANGRSHALSVTAPVAGIVTVLNSGVGSYLNDTTATLMTIANLDNVWVTASVPEDMVASVTKGQSVQVELPAYPGQVFHGTVSLVSAVLEPDTHRSKTRIAFANPDGRLKPNMYASVNLAVPQSGRIAVPPSALLMNNDNTTVFVEVAPWTFVRRVVELGQEDGDSVRILSGLSAGERIVVRGGVLLND